jgi:hypothetical protein
MMVLGWYARMVRWSGERCEGKCKEGEESFTSVNFLGIIANGRNAESIFVEVVGQVQAIVHGVIASQKITTKP